MAKNTDEKLNIQEAIKAFAKDDISKAGINLFSVLGYDTSLQAPLDKKTFTEFKEDYIEASPAVDRFNEEKALSDEWKTIDILFQLTDDSFTGQQQLFDSKLNPLNPQSYLCFAIELNGNEYSKTQIAGITREVNKLFSIPIIIVFKYGECITLAIINRRVNKRDSDRDVLEKVTLIKDIFFEKPHRAHIEILFDMSLAQLSTDYTITNFESLHKAWSEVLDTQTLNKRFYTELSNWYFWAIKTVVYPGYEMEAARGSLFTKEEKVREHNAKNLIRLLTRLLFVWFIKEKDLIPEELFDENRIKEIITNFEPEKQYDFTEVLHEPKSIYYKAILQNLFFASLNAEHGKRAFRIDGQNQNATSLMRYQRYHKNPEAFVKLIESKVPFMNGGLFECLDHQDDERKGKKGGAVIDYEDGFSDRKDNELFVPDYVFFGKDVKVDLSTEYDDKKKKDVTVNGIINILQKYKFTIAENTPVEEDIALDPELLGRVFENLLASYNPETKTNARKQTGSFYTPRPIVEYMVDESLKAYLKTKIKDAALSKGTLEEKTKAVEEIEKSLDSKLDNLIAYNESEPEFTEDERFQILKYIDECKILDPACGSGAFPMGILQKMVYVIHKLDPQNDNWKQIQIQKISNDTKLTPKEKNELQKEILTVFDDNELDYARKLYLIENCIHGIDIQPIATQISRLRFFISLIVDQKVDGNKANFGVRPLPNLENRFVTANSLIGLDNQTGYLAEAEIIDLKEELKTIRHKLFSAKSPSYKFELKQKDKEIRHKMEQVLLDSGFGKQNASMISTWDPYDKNKSADFFDAEWMFGIKDGFDIVIGNPPYLRVQGLRANYEKESKIYEQKFKCATGRFDFYVLFMEMGYSILKRNGILSYILPHKFINADFGKGIRKFIYDNKALRYLVHFGEEQVFGKASVYTCIVGLSYGNKEFSFAQVNPKEIENGIQFEKICEDKLSNVNRWTFQSGGKAEIIDKLNTQSLRLKDVVQFCNQGTVSMGDDLYMMKGHIDGGYFIGFSEQLQKEVKLEKDIMKPLLRGKDIKRYGAMQNSYFEIYPHHLVDGQTVPYEEKELKTQFPLAYEYLLPFKKELKEKKVKYKTNPDYWYALHRAREIMMFEQPKIITPQISFGSNMTYDINNLYHNAKGYTIILKDKYRRNTLAYLAIFNSPVMWFFLTQTGDVLRGGFFTYTTHYMYPFPLPELDNEISQKLSFLVDKILAAKKANPQADTSKEEAEIDRLVYELYGLSEDEIKIVEGK